MGIIQWRGREIVQSLIEQSCTNILLYCQQYCTHLNSDKYILLAQNAAVRASCFRTCKDADFIDSKHIRIIAFISMDSYELYRL